MSDDKYPRVHRTAGGGCWLSDDGGWPRPCNEKVVPADAIVIERVASSPEAISWSEDLVRSILRLPPSWISDDDTLAKAEAVAINLLIAVAHLREHPPADEAEVERVSAALAAEFGRFRLDYSDIARRLVAKGVRVDGAR